MFNEKKIEKPYGIAFWFEQVTMSYIWYETIEERDKVLDELLKGEKLKIKWDYCAYYKEFTYIKALQFYAINAVTPMYISDKIS